MCCCRSSFSQCRRTEESHLVLFLCCVHQRLAGWWHHWVRRKERMKKHLGTVLYYNWSIMVIKISFCIWNKIVTARPRSWMRGSSKMGQSSQFDYHLMQSLAWFQGACIVSTHLGCFPEYPIMLQRPLGCSLNLQALFHSDPQQPHHRQTHRPFWPKVFQKLEPVQERKSQEIVLQYTFF